MGDGRATQRAWPLFAVLCLGGYGCHGGPGSAPRAVAQSYAAGLIDGDTMAAYAALSPAQKAQLSETQFADRIERSPARSRSYGRTVEQALGRENSVEIVSECGDGVRFRYEDGKWRLSPESLEVYSQSSPEETLRTLVRAAAHGRDDVLDRLWASAAEDPDRGALKALADLIQLSLESADIEVLGPHARLRYGTDKSIELVLEGLDWKIEEFDR
jgi:hypothetical protein